jgi:peroxiredoxin
MKRPLGPVLAYLGFAAVCLVLGGVLVFNLTRLANSEPEPRHRITPEMRRLAAAASHWPAPEFTRKDTDGLTLDLASLLARRPVYLVFIKEGCPCSIEAQPFFERLYKKFGDRVQFVAVTDGTPAEAREWKAHFQVVYPMLSEPKAGLMHDFKALHSAYSALITKEEGVVHLWPGYSRGELDSIVETLNLVTGRKQVVAFDDAPRKPTTGCTF